MVVKRRITSFAAMEDAESLEEVCDLIEAGHLRPVIDSEYPLEQAAEALALVKAVGPPERSW